MYLPLAAVVTLIVITVGPRLRRQTANVALAAVCLALAAGTVLRNREYQSALTMAQTVIDRWPTPFAHTMMGTEFASLGRPDEAIAHLRQGADQFPKASYHLGEELFKQGQVEEAYARLSKFVEQEPYALQAVSARSMMGRMLLSKRDYAAAIDQLSLVLSMTNGNDDLHIVALALMGNAVFGRGQYDDAARYYRNFLDARPNDIPVRGNLAQALFNQGRVDDAVAEARAILRVREDAVARDLLGRVLASQGSLDEARQEFERALIVDPNFAQARMDLEAILRVKR